MKSDGKESASDEEVTSKNTRASRVNKVARANRPAEMTVNRDFCHTTIFGLGTEQTVIGNPAWSIRKLYSRPLNMLAVDSNMSSVAMKMCGTFTAVQR
eukprot:6244716-Ditylum_brightwellii.AAC.2